MGKGHKGVGDVINSTSIGKSFNRSLVKIDIFAFSTVEDFCVELLFESKNFTQFKIPTDVKIFFMTHFLKKKILPMAVFFSNQHLHINFLSFFFYHTRDGIVQNFCDPNGKN